MKKKYIVAQARGDFISDGTGTVKNVHPGGQKGELPANSGEV